MFIVEAKVTPTQKPKAWWNTMATAVATISGTVVMLAITVAIIRYSASLEDRVITLESHAGALTAAPSAGATPTVNSQAR